ncbi:SDR family NAD(P)-dependent oxidoreductase [Streptomyces massasporeus]|uniref:SDR family NAD(P)-dependent oxidoreductase n=1 Tax=Streptomyces massasporeus TaxID=67324 RepID=UPI003685D620
MRATTTLTALVTGGSRGIGAATSRALAAHGYRVAVNYFSKERTMSHSPNIALIRRLHESGMAPEVSAEIMAPDLVWDITPGFPNSGVYHGCASAAKDFFGEMMPKYESFSAVP